MLDLSLFKLRAWDRKDGKMLYFQGNDDADNLSRLESRNDLNIKNDIVTLEILAGTSNRSFRMAGDPTVPVEEFDLMLYTYHFDVDKQQICMGDIVKYDSEDIKGGTGLFYIDISNGNFVFQYLQHFSIREDKPTPIPWSLLSSVHTTFDRVKILGNVFENPKMLLNKSY